MNETAGMIMAAAEEGNNEDLKLDELAGKEVKVFEKTKFMETLEEKIAENPNNVDLLIQLGAEYTKQGLYLLAMRQCRLAIAIDPKCADAYDAYIDTLKNFMQETPHLREIIQQKIKAVVKTGEMNGVYSEGAEKFMM